MPVPNTKKWMDIAEEFEERWNFPHCLARGLLAQSGMNTRQYDAFPTGARPTARTPPPPRLLQTQQAPPALR
ncbi:hypothetical protein FJT64_003903 [Amphibalanus amphitrite]|uniref:Uncharacterized protein n=1 Tax=Amphibalanus amphitrite TaxID=1232801 RepID=A0A6A4VYM5_AMPAM|nr:hypothetical protein FJT64_003903 [Amphibalanus amphitrite]